MLLVVGDREPVFDQHDPRAHQHALELRHGPEELLVFLVGAEAHHPLDAGAVVPAAVEQHDLAAGRQMRDVALEIPLACARARSARAARPTRHDARVEALRDALDGAALAGRVASLEDHDQLELLGHDPVLQLDQLALQPEQLLEIKLARQGVVRFKMFGLRQEVGELVVLELELDVLVEIVLDLGVDALLELAGRTSFIRAHCSLPWFFVRGATKWRRQAKCSTIAATVLRQARRCGSESARSWPT